MATQPENLQIEERIRDFVARNLLYSDDGFPYPDGTSFLQEGIIDSLGVLELVEFAQKAFAVKIDQGEVTRANFDSVTTLATFVRNKLAGNPQSDSPTSAQRS